MVTAIARTKPPKNRITIGSAMVARICLWFTSVPRFSAGMPLTRGEKLLSLTIITITIITSSDVHHVGMASVNHSKAAVINIATMRCSTIVSPGNP